MDHEESRVSLRGKSAEEGLLAGAHLFLLFGGQNEGRLDTTQERLLAVRRAHEGKTFEALSEVLFVGVEVRETRVGSGATHGRGEPLQPGFQEQEPLQDGHGDRLAGLLQLSPALVLELVRHHPIGRGGEHEEGENGAADE